MASQALAGLRTHDDEVGIQFLGGMKDFFDGGAKGDAEFGLAPVFAALRHELLHAHDVNFALAGDAFFGISGGTLDDVEKAEASTMLLSEREGVSSGFFRAGAEVRGEQNIVKVDLFGGVAFHGGADGKHGAFGLTEDFFGDRADEDLLNFAATVGADNHEIDLMVDDELFKGRPDVALFHQDFVGYAAQFAGDEDVRNTLLGGLANFFIGSLGELRFGELERIWSDDMSEVDASVIATR